METVSRQKVSRSLKCARCRNHGFMVALKGHVGQCRFSRCGCWKCALIAERTRIMARQRVMKKRQREEQERTGHGDPASGVRGRVTKSPVRATHTEDNTCTELEPPALTESGACAPTPNPEIAQKSSDHCKGSHDRAVFTDLPHFPWENSVAEIPQNTVYSGDLPMMMPLHLHTHYTNTFTPPAFLVSFGTSPLGAVGLPHVPPAALMESRPEGPGFFYMPGTRGLKFASDEHPDLQRRLLLKR
ncbi:hypothetical protein Q7C36_004983 [Tachysurus vachellii]|uniref:DM domain-containing protein n=1 Tax=Tachysurus vachellii TaxID=175792 RepID=A0AA88NQ44_TACVA|nr:hypothetical protein Q7C36_004983 [Tachysurus vachellii]